MIVTLFVMALFVEINIILISITITQATIITIIYLFVGHT